MCVTLRECPTQETAGASAAGSMMIRSGTVMTIGLPPSSSRLALTIVTPIHSPIRIEAKRVTLR